MVWILWIDLRHLDPEVCKHCRQRCPGHYLSAYPRVSITQDTSPQSTAATNGVSSTASTSPTLINISDLSALVRQILSTSGNPSTASSVSSSISPWYFDSGCSNHMTSDASIFSIKSSESSFPVIHTTNGSSMTVDHVGHVSTSALSLSHTYYVPKLTINLVSVGQLCDLGLTILFSSTGCVVQDPRTGKTLGIGRRHGRLFQLVHLHLPISVSTVATTSASSSSSFGIWHSRLGHVSSGRVFRSDNAQEYLDTSFLNFFRAYGTLSHRSCPDTSQQNGRAEHKHRHLLDTTRALLISSGCLERFWGKAALTATYTINRIPLPLLGNLTPYECLYGTPPDYHSLRVFGCACFVLLQPHERTKLEPRSRLCCFLGYGIEYKAVFFFRYPYLIDSSIELFLEDVDVPAVLPDDASHYVTTVFPDNASNAMPPATVYPVESLSIDSAPPVAPLVPLPSDFPVHHSTRSAHGIVLLILYVDDIIITGDDAHGISELKDFLHCHFEMKDLGPLSYFLGLESTHGIVLLILYVDDIIITGDNAHGISELKDFLNCHFEMKDLGPLSYFLGLEISFDSTGYSLTQAKYASDLLTGAGISNYKTASTPLEANVR
ncbi:hypothetical protein Acr_00g0021810 [Actinidia rufa]|uniref:Integrase catalytic domain-containing protein n=1 Tax=Actinidia rufa TaxID=165716 RepID=A0A7J0DCD3_9ERIC|nr:hypothetical protein Acr_00g0021810 [Actinidia rufa]